MPSRGSTHPRDSTRLEPARPRAAAAGEVAPTSVFVSRTYSLLRRASRPAAHDFVQSTLQDCAGMSFQIVVRVFHDRRTAAEVATSHAHVAGTGLTDGNFAHWLSAALQAKGLSQHAAARQLGVSARTMNRWVRGDTEPRLRDVRRINGMFT